MGAIKQVWHGMIEDCRTAADEIESMQEPEEFIINRLARVIQNLSSLSADCHTVVGADIYDMATSGYKNICFGTSAEACEDCENHMSCMWAN